MVVDVKFWMMRVAEEHNKVILERLKRIGDLFFQTVNFDKMSEQVKFEVKCSLINDMVKLGWDKEVSEYFGDMIEKLPTYLQKELNDQKQKI